jgi:hypothetical protein
MPLLSARMLVPIAVVVLAWGGVHLLSPQNLAVSPAVWPAQAAPSPSPPAVVAVAPPSSSPAGASLAPGPGGEVPILPGVLKQVDGSTRDTAVGLYALLQQLEQALVTHLQQLARQLEPGR